MSRSLHTRPLRVRAAARVSDPFAPRGREDARNERAAHRELRALGLVPVDDLAVAARDPAAPPRVIARPPRPDHLHPAAPADVEELLRRLGPTWFHGLRTIELRPGVPYATVFGRYSPVGRIVLFDVPAPPWRLRLAPVAAERFGRAGAALANDGCGGHEVTWPGDSLRRFVLLDVLLHELGHHLLQHHRGKRPARIARTRDHEAHADLLARRARELLGGVV